MLVFDSEMSLHDFVSRYIPSNWCESISSCAFVPYWSREQYLKFKNNEYDGMELKWYEKEAIIEFFKQLT